MRRPDRHQPRTLFFRPGETVTLQATARSKNSKASFRIRRGSDAVKKSDANVVFRMPKDELGVEIAELDVNFAGRWAQLHLDHAGIEVSIRGSKGEKYKQRIFPGPKVGRWTYRLVSAKPGRTLYFCPESDCRNRMLPNLAANQGAACSCCGGKRMIPVKVPFVNK